MRYFEEMDSGIIYGGRRQGKTKHLIFLMDLAYNEGYEVMTNLKTSIPHTHISDKSIFDFMDQLKNEMSRRDHESDYHKTFLGIDEMHIIVPAQLWKKCAEDGRVWAQVGKMGFTVYATAPQFNMVYNGYRDSCNRAICCKRIDDNRYKAIYKRQSDEDYTIYKTYFKCVIDGQIYHDKYSTRQLMYT